MQEEGKGRGAERNGFECGKNGSRRKNQQNLAFASLLLDNALKRIAGVEVHGQRRRVDKCYEFFTFN